jgi:hypothetical protein
VNHSLARVEVEGIAQHEFPKRSLKAPSANNRRELSAPPRNPIAQVLNGLRVGEEHRAEPEIFLSD